MSAQEVPPDEHERLRGAGQLGKNRGTQALSLVSTWSNGERGRVLGHVFRHGIRYRLLINAHRGGFGGRVVFSTAM